MSNPTQKRLDFLVAIDQAQQASPPTPKSLQDTLKWSKQSITQQLKTCMGRNLITMSMTTGLYPSVGYILTPSGKQAINGHARDPEKLHANLAKLAKSWPFHMHETYQDTGYGADIHNKHNRIIASFRNIERARAFMIVVEELLKNNHA